MKVVTVKFVLCVLMTLAWSGKALAAGAEAELESAGVNLNDRASLQRGARLFVNYCLSCHGADYMRYKRLSEDLGLSEELVQDNLIFGEAKIGERMTVAMDPEDSERWFGQTPPNLSLVARARGADWLYHFLRTFYRDENGRWNNLALPNAAMPHVLWQLQGIQTPANADHGGGEPAAGEHLELTTRGLLSPAEYDATVRDLVAFLEYMSEPAKLKRKNVGIWVIAFLAVFTFIAYLLKREYWRDIH